MITTVRTLHGDEENPVAAKATITTAVELYEPQTQKLQTGDNTGLELSSTMPIVSVGQLYGEPAPKGSVQTVKDLHE